MNMLMRAIAIRMLAVTMSTALHAQWIQSSGPYGGTVNCFAVSGTNLFAGAWNGVYRSTDNGTSWTAIGLANHDVRAFAVSGANLFAGIWPGGVFHSTDN